MRGLPAPAATGTDLMLRNHLVAAPTTAFRVTRQGVTALDFWAFVLPAISFISVTFVGQLIVSELIAAVMLPWLWSVRDRASLPRWFIVLLSGWLLGQIATDLVAGSAFADYSRGWAAIVFTFTDFAAIFVLTATPRRARLFALGLAAGGMLGYFLNPDVYAAAYPWKFAFAIPIGFAIAAGLSGSFGDRLRWSTVGAFVVFGALNLLLGFRSLGGVSLLTAGYLTLSAIASHPKAAQTQSMLRAAAGLIFLAVAVVGVLQVYDAAASQGLLGANAQTEYLSQSGALGVLVGGRSEVLASTQAIIDSPILGHGSWAKDIKYVDLRAAQLGSLGYVDPGFSDVSLIPAHSYLMQAWVWAGVLGGVFWLAVLGVATWLLANLYSTRAALVPLLAFSTLLLLWNIVFSPYGSGQRFLAGFAFALCLLGLRVVRDSGFSEELSSTVGRLPSLDRTHS